MKNGSTTHPVMTLTDAAKFLRIKESVLKALAEQGRVPARKGRSAWQFSQIALDKWLLNGIEPEIALLRQAGTCKDDPDLMTILADIYKKRGRPEREEE